jgi:hypothetical protein
MRATLRIPILGLQKVSNLISNLSFNRNQSSFIFNYTSNKFNAIHVNEHNLNETVNKFELTKKDQQLEVIFEETLKSMKL